LRARARRTISLAETCCFLGLDVNAAYSIPATSASETQQSSWSSQMACGYLIPVRSSALMQAIAARTEEFTGTVIEKYAPLRRIVPMTAAL
jgi:hypothetical protein